MTQISRKTAVIFGSNAGTDQISEFGSLAAGTPAYTTDPAVIQSLSNYLTGWFGAVIGNNSPAIEDMNSLCYLFSYQIAYVLQSGIPQWDSGTTYYIGNFASDGAGNLYYSLTDNNLNNALTNSTFWKIFSAGNLNPGSDGQVIKSLNSAFVSSSYYNTTVNYIGNAFGEVNTNGWGSSNWQQTVTITIASPGVFTVASTIGFYVGMPISFKTTGALPTGLTSGTTYYIFSVNSSTSFEVSASLGGSVVNTSGTQSGTHTSYPLVPINNTSASLAGLTFSRNTTSPIRGSADFKLVQTNSTVVGGQGLTYNFTIDPADEAQVLSVQFDYNASSTFVASSGQVGSDSDLEVAIWDVTNSILIPVNPKVLTANGANNFSFKGTFQTASNSKNYSLILYTPTMNSNATGWAFHFTNVYVGRQVILQGAAITDLTSYIPTFDSGWGTASNINCFWKRIGDEVELHLNFQTGITAASSSGITIPSGLVSDSSIGSSASGNYTLVGRYTTNNPASGNIKEGPFIIAPSSNKVFVSDALASDTNSGLAPVVSTTAYFPANTSVSAILKFKVQGWSSNVQMSNDADTRVVAMEVRQAAPTATITGTLSLAKFTATPTNDTNGAFNTSTGLYVVQSSGFHRCTAQLVIQGTYATNQFSFISIAKNGTTSTNGVGVPISGNAFPQTTQTLYCNAGDTLAPYVASSATSPTIGSDINSNYFSVERLSGPSVIAATDTIACKYYMSSNQSVTAGTQFNFDSKVFDTTGSVTTGGGAWKFVAPISTTYNVSACFASTGANATTLSLYKNGTSDTDLSEANGTIGGPFSGTTLIHLNAGEFIDVRPNATNTYAGGSVPYITWISIHAI